MTESYKARLKSRFYGLLCEYEKEGEWEKFLNTISIEMMGIDKADRNDAYAHLVINLNALRFLSYTYFRSTIFDCMNLVDKL